MDDRTDFQIDALRLDYECQRQSGLVKAYGDMLADAQLDLKELEDQLEVREADVNLSVRRRPEDFDVPKVTDDVVKQLVVLDAKAQKLRDQVRTAQHKVNVFKASCKSLDDKKSMLEVMDRQVARGWHAEPFVAPESRDRQAANKEREINHIHARKGVKK